MTRYLDEARSQKMSNSNPKAELKSALKAVLEKTPLIEEKEAEIMRRAIDEAAIDQPTMPVLIERLAQKGIMAEVSYHSNSQVRGIRFSINVGEVDELGLPKLLSMTGGGLNRHKYSFPKLQSELGISYIPSRDDLALRATVGNAQKLLSASPIINISQTNETEFQDSSHPETESSQKLEQLQSKISRTIDAAAANQPTLTQFIHRLQSRGINPRVLLTRTGKIQGISFVLEGEEFSGTSLGANYSFKGLQRFFGVDFDLERDAPSLAAIAHSNSKRKSAIHNQPTERIIQLLKENPDKGALSMTGLASAPKWQSTESEDTASLTRRGGELHPEKRFSSEMGSTEDEESIQLNGETNHQSPQHPFSESERPDQLSQLSDAELVALFQAVKQWKKNCPEQPSLERGEELKQLLDDLQKQKANLEKELLAQVQELERLGKPRSLLNPFGVSAEEIDNKRIEIRETRTALYGIEFQLRSARENFEQWQQKVRNYQAWQEAPPTQQMRQLAEELKSPPIRERLQRLNEGYALHAAAQYILDNLGKQKDNSRYFQGKVYCIEERGEMLTISHQDREQPLYVATDRRGTGGIIEISQFNLTPSDSEIIQGYAEYLQQQQVQNLQSSPQLER